MYLMATKNWKAEDIDTESISHLIIAFARIGGDFKISDWEMRLNAGDKNDIPLPDIVSSPLISVDKWAEIEKIRAKNPKLKIIGAVGGWGAEGFSDMAETPVTIDIFTDSVAEYVQKHNLDGFDLDWEYPTAPRGIIKTRPSDRENFTALLKSVREKIGPDKEISYCTAAGKWFLDAIELYETVRYANSIHIMTYDMAGTWDTETRHHTNLYTNPNDPESYKESSVSLSAGYYLNEGIPPEAITIGYAAYGREFRGVASSVNNGLYQKFTSKNPHIWQGGTIDFDTLEKYYINKNGYTRFWDEHSRAPYLYSQTERNFITYDDCESVREKAKFAKEKKLGGIMCWEYTNDMQAKLMKTVYDEINK
jgi:chitinase